MKITMKCLIKCGFIVHRGLVGGSPNFEKGRFESVFVCVWAKRVTKMSFF